MRHSHLTCRITTPLIAAAFLAAFGDAAAAAAPRPPVRVLFCIADDASPSFGAYGCTWAKTPAIDRLAREGVKFDRAYTPTAKCSPSRAALLTGRYPWQLEAAHRVPLIVRWPGKPGDRRVAEFVNFVDLAPTFLDLYGIHADASGLQPITGRSLADLLRGEPMAAVARDATIIGRERLAARLMAALNEQRDPRVLGGGDAFDDYPAPPYAKKLWAKEEQADRERDVVIYGGTSGALIAAIRAALLGADVVVVSPDEHLGGLTSGGLGYTDSGNTQAIGGLAREFYRRVWRHYQQPEAWRWQPRDTFAALGQGVKKSDVGDNSMWLFEPHVAEKIFDEWLAEHGIEVVREALLDREKGVEMGPRGEGGAGPRIKSITTLAGPAGPARRFAGRIFIDATYEGDLMAAAGVTYHVGREDNSVYGEEWNGNQVGVLHHGHHWKMPVDPFKEPGNPKSGLLPLVSADPPGTRGAGDARVQAYCFRMCLTDHPDNRVPFAKPAGYDPARYELLARTLAAGWREVFAKFDAIPNRKTDTNNHGPFSFDHIGANYDYPEASYERRREIIADHERYQQGLLWFLAHDERVPADVRTRMQSWGLPKDEYGDNGHWSPQLYIREARRMVGDDMLTEHECLGNRAVKKPIGMGSYALDSHNVRRYVTSEGTVQNEGDIGVYPKQPYQIGYGALVPKKAECTNLLVPVCVSASHIAYGSARMEPVFMLLGDAAANAAVLAARANAAVQDVDYASLRGLLEAQGQVLEIR